MTIASTTSRNTYVGAGSVGPFAYTFRIFAATDLVVTTRDLTGLETTLSYPADFSVTGVGSGSGGTVTLATALTSGWTLSIRRAPALLQSTSIRNQGAYDPATVEDALDMRVMQLQSIEDLLARSVHLGETVDPTTLNLALPVPAAGKALVWNAGATGFDNATLSAAQLSAWSATHNLTVDVFTAGFTPGSTTTLTLSAAPGNVNNIVVTMRISGTVRVFERDEYSVSSTTLAFTSAIPSGTTRIEVTYLYTYQVNAAASENVSFAAAGGSAVQRTVRDRLRDEVNVKDYGAVGNGSTDDTAALTAAIAALAALPTGGGRLRIPSGNYLVSSVLTFSAMQGFTVIGDGPTSTKITVTGGHAAFNLFRLWGCRDASFEGLQVTSSVTNPLTAAFALETKSGATISNITFRNIILQGTNSGGLDKGFKTIPGTGGDANNDNHAWYNCVVNNYGTAAWSFEHAQSKGHLLMRCTFGGDFSFSERGVATNQGAGGQGGSFACYSTGGGANSEADFDLGDANDYVIIDGGRIEQSARFLRTGGPSGANFPVIVRGLAWAVTSAHLPADKKVLIYKLRGPLVVQGCAFGSGSDFDAILVTLDSGGVANAAFIANHFDCTLTDPFDPSTGALPAFRIGNTIDRDDSAGVVQLEPLTIVNRTTGAEYINTTSISGTATRAKNLRGTFTISGAATSAAVSLTTNEPDATYFLVVAPTLITGTPAAGANRIKQITKASDQFGVFLEAAPGVGNTQSFDWVLIR